MFFIFLFSASKPGGAVSISASSSSVPHPDGSGCRKVFQVSDGEWTVQERTGKTSIRSVLFNSLGKIRYKFKLICNNLNMFDRLAKNSYFYYKQVKFVCQFRKEQAQLQGVCKRVQSGKNQQYYCKDISNHENMFSY